MIMARSGFFLALAFMFLPGFALAERIVVRSGEHDGFSRLVLDLPRSLGWELQTDGSEARLMLKGNAAEFDLSDAFRRLSAARVSEITPLPGRNALAITLGCACDVEAFRLGEEMLVLDIRDVQEGGPPKPSVAAQARVGDDPSKPGAAYSFPFEPQRHDNGIALSFGKFSPPVSSGSPGVPVTEPPNSTEPTGLNGQVARARRLSEAEQRLVSQLSRAASQGLVTPRGPHLPQPGIAGPTADIAHPEPASQPSPPGLNLRVETSADRDFARLLGALEPMVGGRPCPSDTALDIAAWGDEAPFGEQVGVLRARLFGEFDKVDPQAARQLAKLYVYFGFGAEALHVLHVSGASGTDAALLKAMAEIMEQGHAQGPNPLTGQFECESHAALWAVLAQERLPLAAYPDGAALLRGVNALPPHIRGHLGPVAAQRLAMAGRKDLAAQVLRLVERGQAKPDARFEMADAALHLAEGDPQSAAMALGRVVDASNELSPKALVELIESRLEAALPLDVQTADLAGAYALEYRGAALGAELKRAHILALADVGAYDEAFGELALFAAQAAPETVERVRSHAMAVLAGNADDIPFLKYALDTQSNGTLAPASANAVAERLIALGFPQKADAYLGPVLAPRLAGSDGRSRQLLRAQSALAQHKPRRTEAELIGLAGPEADLLRAEARAMSGDHASASRLFATLDRDADSIEQAWLAADWKRLDASGDPLWQDAAKLVSPDPAESVPAGVLARNRALLEGSAAARARMSALLGHLPVDTGALARN